MWKDSVPDTSLFLVRTSSIFSSLTRLCITPKKKGEGNTPHCRQSLELSLIGERQLWPQLRAVMESCWCDSSFLHSQTRWDRWKQSVIPLLPILQESETDSNLVKAEWDAFNGLSTCSIWKAQVSMLSEHHWQENQKRGESWYTSSYEWIQMLEFTYFYFYAQLKVWG